MEDKTKIGIFFSFCTFFIYVAVFLFVCFVTQFGVFLAFLLPSFSTIVYLEGFPFIAYFIVLPLIFSLPFLLLNSVIMILGDKDWKKGVMMGYIFTILLFLMCIVFIKFFGIYDFAMDDYNWRLGTEKSDEAACFKILDKIEATYCFTDVANQKKDIAICDKIVSDDVGKYMCQEDVAIELNDISLCYKINDNDFRNGCIENININNRDKK